MKVFSNLSKKIKSKINFDSSRVRAFAKRVLPLSFAIVPGGLAVGLSLSMAERQAQIGQELNTRIARQEFVERFGGIDGSTLVEAETKAGDTARDAMNDYLTNNPNSTMEQAQQIFDDTYTQVKAGMLDLSEDDLRFFETKMYEFEQEIDLENNMESIMDEFWRSQGFGSAEEAANAYRPLIDAAQNGDFEAVKALGYLDRSILGHVYDVVYCRPFSHNLPTYATQQVPEANGLEFIDAVAAGLSANPEIGVLGAVGALGAAVCGYGAYKYVESKWQDRHVQSTVDELFRS